MKKLIGVSLIIVGVLLGLYVGGYLMFIKAVMGIVSACKDDFNGVGIAIGIFKIIFSGFVGAISGIVPLFIGVTLTQD